MSKRVAVTFGQLRKIVRHEESPIRKIMWKAYAFTGARLSEMLMVTSKDISLERGFNRYVVRLNSLKSASTGIYERFVPISKTLATELKRVGNGVKGPIFPFKRRAVQHWFTRACYKAGVVGKSVGCLRHTFATYVFVEKNIYHIQHFKEVMGHRGLTGIAVYDDSPDTRFSDPPELRIKL